LRKDYRKLVWLAQVKIAKAPALKKGNPALLRC